MLSWYRVRVMAADRTRRRRGQKRRDRVRSGGEGSVVSG
jgi:hypothetical protein